MSAPLSSETRSAIIAAVRAGEDYSKIAGRFQIGRPSVSRIAVKAGIRKAALRPCVLAGSQIAEIGARYTAGEKAADLATEFHVSDSTIRDTIRAAGYQIRGPARVQRPFRHDAFDVITPEAAYWLGMMFTDGTVNRRSSGQPEVALALQGRDREHLVKFRAFLGSDHAITPVTTVSGFGGTGHFRYSVRSRRLAERLEALGRYGPCVNPELAKSRDFWRGAIDGDGCLGLSCDLPQLKLFGSRWLLQAFVDFIGPPGPRGRPVTVRPSHSIFVVGISGGRAVRVTKRLYSEASVTLDRKAETAAKLSVMEPPFIWPCNR